MDAVAIIGVGCSFPCARNPQELWQLLVDGRDGISEVPGERWDAERYYSDDPMAAGKVSSRWGGFVADLTEFDPEHFGISQAEAVRIDPQHKLMLEVCHQALENSGIAVKSLAGSNTGVFAGVSHSDQDNKLKRDLMHIDANLGVHTYHCFAANRVSYHLNLQGPSLAVDSACSSSLLAVHLACQSLLSGECDLALAGGVNVHLMAEESVSSAKMGLLSPDGQCRSFAEGAAGHARSEGCGVIVLRRLADAVAQREHIWAIIRGSATNHNGASNGITAPNGPAQERVIQSALKRAGVRPSQLGYVEAHATATPLGDQVEWSALHQIFASDPQRCTPCYVGSVKSNLGHLEAAAGIAGLIKCVLALQHQLIPRSLHTERPHPKLMEGPLLQLAKHNTPWRVDAGALRTAGVSAFAFGGSNCHVVLEEGPPPVTPSQAMLGAQLVTLSARSESALTTLREKLTGQLRNEAAALHEVAYSLNTGRTSWPVRCAVVARSCAELTERLTFADNQELGPVQGRAARTGPLLVFVGASSVSLSAAVRTLRAGWPSLSDSVDRKLPQLLPQALPEERERLADLTLLGELLWHCGARPTSYVASDAVGAMAAWWLHQQHFVGQPSPLWRAAGTYDLKAGTCAALEVEPPTNRPVQTLMLSAAQDRPGDGEPLLSAAHVRHWLLGADIWHSFLTALGHLWVAGVAIDFRGLHSEQTSRRVLVPNYPFEKKRSWFVLCEPKEDAPC